MKKGMINKKTIIGFVLGGLWFYPYSSSAVPSEVFDPLVYTLCEKLLTSMKALKEVQNEVIQSIFDVSSVMGGHGSFSYSEIKGYLNQAKSLQKTFTSLVPRSVALKPQETTQALRDRLTRLIHLDARDEEGQGRHQTLMAERDTLLSEMTLNALTLSVRSTALIERDYEQLGEIVAGATQTRDLRTDVATTNNLLMLLIHQTIQMRMALTHLMGVAASDTLRHSPLLLRNETSTPTRQGDFPWGRLS